MVWSKLEPASNETRTPKMRGIAPLRANRLPGDAAASAATGAPCPLGRLAREVRPKQPSPMSVSWKTLHRTSQGVSLALSRADAIHPEVV